MATIISVDFTNEINTQKENTINAELVSKSRRKLRDGMLLPPTAEVTDDTDLAGEHTSEPIKSIDDIDRISQYLLSNERYRDNMLFIVGINFGLRVSDLVRLKFSHLINSDYSFKTTFPILEKKTRNTRKVKRNRYISINDAVMDAVTTYLEHNQCKLDDYMFRGESNRCSNQNKPLTRCSVDRILKDIADNLNLECKIATHSLRKTFGYHQMLMSNNDPRKLLLLQKIFGHSSAAQTLDYIGITSEEIEEAYMNLNLGSRQHYLVDSKLQETVLQSVG